jgi:hypothetical protein
MPYRAPYRQTFEDWIRALNAAGSWQSLENEFTLFRDAQNDLLRRLNELEWKQSARTPTREQKS